MAPLARLSTVSRHRPSSPRQPHSPTLPRCTRPPSRTARESHTLSPVRPIAPAILNDAALDPPAQVNRGIVHLSAPPLRRRPSLSRSSACASLSLWRATIECYCRCGAPPRHASEPTYGELRLSSPALRKVPGHLGSECQPSWPGRRGCGRTETALGPEFARAAPPAIRYSHACRGPSGPLNRTGLTLAVPHTPGESEASCQTSRRDAQATMRRPDRSVRRASARTAAAWEGRLGWWVGGWTFPLRR